MTKMSKKQLHVLLMCCHKQGVTILGKIQIVSKDSAKKYNLTARVMKALGLSISKDCYLQRGAEKDAIETDINANLMLVTQRQKHILSLWKNKNANLRVLIY